MDKTILITGCNKRVGHDLAAHLLSEGYRIIGAVRLAPTIPIPGVEYIEVDLTNQEQLTALIDKVRTEHRVLRAIIHNASQWLADSSENLETMHKLHVLAPFRINTELAELIRRAERCDIVHICDDTASRGTANHIAYAATKSALLNMTLSFAKWFPEYVRVNAVSPGLLYFKEGSTEEYKTKTVKKAKLEFEPRSEPIVSAVDYLLNSCYVTGSNIVTNGGRHLK